MMAMKFITEARKVESTRCLLVDVVQCLVAYPAGVKVEVIPQKEKMLFLLRVAPSDIALILGKNGHTARSLHVVFGALGAKLGVPISVEVEEAAGDPVAQL